MVVLNGKTYLRQVVAVLVKLKDLPINEYDCAMVCTAVEAKTAWEATLVQAVLALLAA